MFGIAWRLGRIAGIEIRVDGSWLIIALLVTVSLADSFQRTYGDELAAVLLGVAVAILFFASVLAHELAHAITARRRGIPVRGITLFLFGGATHARVEAKGPADELAVTIVGPGTSLGIAAVLGAISIGARDALPAEVAAALGYLAWVNLALAIFNMLPGLPLDGGRILRAAMWRATGDLQRATRIASTSGRVVGYAIAAGGIALLFAGELLSGIWLGAIGWFLARSAEAAYEELYARTALEQATAGDVMARDLVPIGPALSIADAVDEFFMRYDYGAFPVDEEGKTIGLLTFRTVRQVPKEERATRTVRDMMHPIDARLVVDPEAGMTLVLDKLTGHGRVLVVRDGEVVGIITAYDVAAWLRRRQLIEDERSAAA